MSLKEVIRGYLTFSSLSYFLVIYLVKEAMSSPSLDISWEHYVCAFILMGSALLLGYVGLLLCHYLEEVSVDVSKIESIEASNDNFLVNYIGFFLIATDMNDHVTLALVFLFLFYLVFRSNVSYFNPAFLAFGYKFYIITTDLKTRIVLITKQTVKKPEDILPFSKEKGEEGTTIKEKEGEEGTTIYARKINEYVFIQCHNNKETT